MENQQQQQDQQQLGVGVGADYSQQQMDPNMLAQFQMQMPGMMMGGAGGMDPQMAQLMQQQYAAGFGQQMPGYGGQQFGGFNQYQMPQPGMQNMGGYGGQQQFGGGYGGAGRGGGFNNQKQNMQRFKTALCRHFENSGQCSLGDKCSFAHGQHELRGFNDPVPAGASFQQNTFQQQPRRDNFGGQGGFQQRSNQGSGNFKTQVCKNFLADSCKYGEKCSFAHGENELNKKQQTFYQPKTGGYQQSSFPQFGGQQQPGFDSQQQQQQ